MNKIDELPSILMEIVREKQKEILKLEEKSDLYYRGENPVPVRDFKEAISSKNSVSIIAEIKFASPSAGIIKQETDPIAIGRIYESAGASAISFITDKKFFMGDLSKLPLLKGELSLPILRKDFILDELQVVESFLMGADAILLIARILTSKKLNALIQKCSDLGIEALTEVHDERDMKKAIDCGASIIGINNRDLDTFKVSTDTTFRLASLIPEDVLVVSESGIENAEDIEMLKDNGIKAALVGTSIMMCEDIETKLSELVAAG
jgi:indole-3-glycerol phosphate synthase